MQKTNVCQTAPQHEHFAHRPSSFQAYVPYCTGLETDTCLPRRWEGPFWAAHRQNNKDPRLMRRHNSPWT